MVTVAPFLRSTLAASTFSLASSAGVSDLVCVLSLLFATEAVAMHNRQSAPGKKVSDGAIVVIMTP